MTEDVKCFLCGQQVKMMDAVSVNKNNTYKCHCCNCLLSRINRIPGKKHWLSPEAKQDFFKLHNQLMGDDLKKKLDTVIKHSERDCFKNRDDEQITWMDEHDLKEKYQHKPDQLQAIMESADTMLDPVKHITLYADVTLVTNISMTHAVHLETKRDISSSFVQRTAKRARKKTAEDAQKAEAHDGQGDCKSPIVHKLTKNRRKNLEKVVPKLTQVKDAWYQTNEHVTVAVRSTLPKVWFDAASKALEDVVAALAEVSDALSDGWMGDGRDVLGRACVACQVGASTNQAMASLIKLSLQK